MSETNGWLPIETAPKDGRRVKLLIPYSVRDKFTDPRCADEGSWDAEVEHLGWGDRSSDPNWKKLRVTRKGCWRFDGDDGAFDMQPTHWQPLPPPSQQEAE